MNADELRRITREAAERRASEAREKSRDRHLESLYGQEWGRARQAVAELRDNIHEAAREGQSEVVVYKIEENELFSITFRQRKRRFGLGRQGHGDYQYTIPDYAQYVFDNCSAELNPHWVVACTSITSCRGPADGKAPTCIPSKFYLFVRSPTFLELRVSW